MTCTPAQQACRRCSECIGQDHHWLSDSDEETGEAFFSCKHCDARAEMCMCELPAEMTEGQRWYGFDCQPVVKDGLCAECVQLKDAYELKMEREHAQPELPWWIAP